MLLTERVSDGHLAGLRQDGVSYIFAGEQELDLGLALGHCHGNGGASPWGKLPAWISSPTADIASRRRSSSTRSGFISDSH
jgi:hypothetical protein